MVEKRAIPEMSVDAQVLMRHLTTIKVGESVSYQTLSELIGRNVQREAYGLLTTARHRLEIDERVLFAPVFGQGLKRLNDAGVIQVGQQGITHIRNHARKVARRLVQCVGDYEHLPTPEKQAYNMALAQAGVLAHMTKPSVAKKLEASITKSEDVSTVKFLEAVRATL